MPKSKFKPNQTKPNHLLKVSDIPTSLGDSVLPKDIKQKNKDNFPLWDPVMI